LRGKIEFYQFLQYLCYQQMTAVKAHATAKGVFLMGDIPILLSPDSADVWNYPSLFQMGLAAGAPPDMFNKEGQYWGFPLYEWEKIAEEGYHWWRQRLQYAQNFYHIYRIDHIVGFFRIWAIPRGEKATKGQFLPQDRTQWVPEGRKKLEAMIAATEMLPIGEDPGVITPEVRTCMQELALCSTKVMRWEKQWEGDLSYTPVQNYPPLSLTCVSTHDSEPLTLWWENQPEEARAYCALKGWRYSRELSQEQRRSILQESHRSNSLFHVNLLHEYFALFPELSWPDPQDARINVPGSVAPTNWTAAFRLPLEEWTAHAGLKQFLREQIY
jgi:4-alpha-glucanotransferase